MPSTRCPWAKSKLLIDYHDNEWGVPSYDDTHLFEHLCLEGFQAGLSWEIVLRKRAATRLAFCNFDIGTVAAFDDARVEHLLQDPGIIRNRAKIRAAITNARSAFEISARYGSFASFVWDLWGEGVRRNSWQSMEQIPALTPDSQRISREMVRQGFKFVGPTGVYAFMQSVGMVNDHLVNCPRYDQVQVAAK